MLGVILTLKGFWLSGVPGAPGNSNAFVEITDNTTDKKIGMRVGSV